MQQHQIDTPLGRIAVLQDLQPSTAPPLVFLHGYFLDSSLWTPYDSRLTQRSHVYIDLPVHGHSTDVDRDWSLAETVPMLTAVLDTLRIPRCIAIGHSLGAMVVLRAACAAPARFAAVGLFNMPWKPPAGLERIGFLVQKQLAAFPRFYAAQAAKALYPAEMRAAQPERALRMQDNLARRSRANIGRLIDAGILQSDDGRPWLQALQVPALAVVGTADTVTAPPGVTTLQFPGGHLSPVAAVEQTRAALLRLVHMADTVGITAPAH